MLFPSPLWELATPSQLYQLEGRSGEGRGWKDLRVEKLNTRERKRKESETTERGSVKVQRYSKN